eukprot:5968223-Pyramimonas_sp.AAC.1
MPRSIHSGGHHGARGVQAPRRRRPGASLLEAPGRNPAGTGPTSDGVLARRGPEPCPGDRQ